MSAAAAEPYVEGQAYVVDGVELVTGQLMTREQLAALPVGSVVYNGDFDPIVEDEVFTKTSMDGRSVTGTSIGTWQTKNSVNISSLASGINTLKSVPGGSWKPEQETLSSYKRRFADFVLTKTTPLSEENQAAAREVLAQLGLLANEGVRVGTVLTYEDQPPNGTVVTDKGPDENFTAFTYEDGWKHVSGPVTHVEDMGRLVACYVPDDPFAEQVGDQAELIAGFQSWIWGKGQELKPQYQWCSALEKILTEFGIPNPGPLPDLSNWPDTVPPGKDNRVALPVGTIVAAADGDWGIFRKVSHRDDKTGRGWQRIAGTRPRCRGEIHILWRPARDMDGDPIEVSIPDIGPLLEFLPVDSVVERGGGRSRYRKTDGREGREWRRIEDGVRRTSAMMRAGTPGATLTLTSFGV